jgi:cytochrome c5
MSEHDSHEHSSFIKTPKQLIAVIVLSFVVPVLVIAMLASLAMRGAAPDPAASSDEAVAKRLKPVGEVIVTAAGGAAAARTGQQVTEAVCAACHATGALNAPKIGDAKAWAPLIKEGHAHLTETAIKGIRQMPPRGGNPELSDVEVARAVAYMANQSGGKFTEPAAPAAAPAQAAAPGAGPAAVAAAPAGATASAAAAGAAGGASQGKSVYDSACVACHGTGVAGAPKTGDKAAWAPRMKQGMPALYEAAMKGKGAMPPKGGNMALSLLRH